MPKFGARRVLQRFFILLPNASALMVELLHAMAAAAACVALPHFHRLQGDILDDV